MGNFANTMFSVLLGWVQRTAAWLWELIGSDGADGLLGWVLDNWLGLAIVLCLAGVAIDLVVYIVRWQPYRVWRSFLQRLSAKGEAAAEEVPEAPIPVRRWVYADGSTQVEERPEGGFQGNLPQDYLSAPIRPTRRMARRASQEQAYHQPVYPPQWQHNEQGEQE